MRMVKKNTFSAFIQTFYLGSSIYRIRLQCFRKSTDGRSLQNIRFLLHTGMIDGPKIHYCETKKLAYFFPHDLSNTINTTVVSEANSSYNSCIISHHGNAMAILFCNHNILHFVYKKIKMKLHMLNIPHIGPFHILQ